MSPALIAAILLVAAALAAIPWLLALPHTGRHVNPPPAPVRIHAGGRYYGTQPRRDAPPLTEQVIITERAGRPWDTAPLPKLTDTPLPTPEQQRREPFWPQERPYRRYADGPGWHGVIPQQQAAQAEGLAGVTLT